MTVLDIVAKSVEANFCRAKGNLRRAQEPPCIVDDTQSDKRRSVWPACLPTADRCQCRNRARQQRRGALIILGLWRNENCVNAGRFERDGADEARWPAANDRHFGGNVSRYATQTRRLADFVGSLGFIAASSSIVERLRMIGV